MPISSIAQILLRLAALKWLVTGLVHLIAFLAGIILIATAHILAGKLAWLSEKSEA